MKVGKLYPILQQRIYAFLRIDNTFHYNVPISALLIYQLMDSLKVAVFISLKKK